MDDVSRKSKLINLSGMYTFLIVSKSGFTEKCLEKMRENRFLYMDLKDLSQLFNKISEND